MSKILKNVYSTNTDFTPDVLILLKLSLEKFEPSSYLIDLKNNIYNSLGNNTNIDNLSYEMDSIIRIFEDNNIKDVIILYDLKKIFDSGIQTSGIGKKWTPSLYESLTMSMV